MKLFPTIVAGVFVALALLAVLIFSTFSARGPQTAGPVLVWGSASETSMQKILLVLQEEETFKEVTYTFVPPESFSRELVSAIASGKSPDLVLMPAASLISQEETLLSIPYDSMSRREFQDTYIEAAEVLMRSDGLKGLPFTADPLVMYWNRSLFSSAAISRPPQYWDELSLNAPSLTKTSGNGTLNQSAAALGTYDNVRYAKPVLLTLLRQLGNEGIVTTEEGYQAVINQRSGETSAGDSAFRFYSEFADPVKPVYSWNRSQQNSRDSFIAGKLAVYFGRASEAFALRAANPNLNFDIARMPQMRGGGAEVETELTILAIPRGSLNPQGALLTAFALSALPVQEILQAEFHTPSVRRDYSVDSAADPYQAIFRAASLASFSFRDPDPAGSESVFRSAVEGISSGAFTVSEAVSQAEDGLAALLGVQ